MVQAVFEVATLLQLLLASITCLYVLSPPPLCASLLVQACQLPAALTSTCPTVTADGSAVRVQTELLSGFFKDCPMVSVPGRVFPVRDVYLDETLALPGVNLKPPTQSHARQARKRSRGGNVSDAAAAGDARQRALAVADEPPDSMDYDLVSSVLQYIDRASPANEDPSKLGAILVFLPGWSDINQLHKRLALLPGAPFAGPRYSLHTLHSQVPTHVQRRVFEHARQGTRKIVLSTNIAEAAVTIPDVVYVVNLGTHKEKTHNEATGVSALKSTWISRASERQRRGRAGRLRPGIAYHLYSQAQSDALLVRHNVVQIL